MKLFGKTAAICLLIGNYSAFASLEGQGSSAPIQPAKRVNDAEVQIGKELFYSTVFSKNGSTSCASCHTLRKGGMDELTTYQTYSGQTGDLNTPTILNLRYHFRYFWDGRAKTLSQALDDHIQDKTIFNNNWESVLAAINQDTELAVKINNKIKEGVTEQSIRNCLVSYLNQLQTPNSAFDRYLQGDDNALSKDAKEGYELFQHYGCITCHQGPALGGSLYQKLGIYKDYFQDKPEIKPVDLGHFNVSQNPADKYVFKVPSLRNVALTAPYFHDGSVKTLEQAINIMATYQVGRPIPSYEIPLLIAFLESLTGRINPKLLEGTP